MDKSKHNIQIACIRIHSQQKAQTHTFSRFSIDFLTILPHVTTCKREKCHVTFSSFLLRKFEEQAFFFNRKQLFFSLNFWDKGAGACESCISRYIDRHIHTHMHTCIQLLLQKAHSPLLSNLLCFMLLTSSYIHTYIHTCMHTYIHKHILSHLRKAHAPLFSNLLTLLHAHNLFTFHIHSRRS